MPPLFITATDTDAGKTEITGLLANYLQTQGQNVITQKWIQCGTQPSAPPTQTATTVDSHFLSTFPDISTHLRWLNKSQSWITPYLKAVCPYPFPDPVSPHLAAQKAGIPIEKNRIFTATTTLSKQFDWVLIEGSGGLFVPINDNSCLIDWVEEMRLPTLVVIPNRLGAINHALLTITALQHRRIPIIGTIWNTLPHSNTPSDITTNNRQIVKKLSQIPDLGEMPVITTKEAAISHFKTIGETAMNELNRAGAIFNGNSEGKKPDSWP